MAFILFLNKTVDIAKKPMKLNGFDWDLRGKCNSAEYLTGTQF
jgi:hypothetical protein